MSPPAQLGAPGAPGEALLLRRELLTTLAMVYGPRVASLRQAKLCSLPLHALAKAQYGQGRGAELAAALLEQLVTQLLAAAKPQELANALYALGELHEDCGFQPDPQHLMQLTAETAGRLAADADRAAAGGAFDPLLSQQLSNSLLACAKLGLREPELLQRLAGVVQSLPATAFSAQALANSLWALARLGCSGPEATDAVSALCGAAVSSLDSYPDSLKPQELSNSLWALATLGCDGPQHAPAVAALLGAVQRRLCSDAASVNAQCLANTLWAAATLGCCGPEHAGVVRALCAALCERLAAQRSSFTGQALSNSLWALAALRCTEAEHLDTVAALSVALADRLQTQPADLAPQALSNSLWALATLGLGTEQPGSASAAVVSAAAAECVRRGFRGFVPVNLSSSVWGLGKLGWVRRDVFAAAEAAAAAEAFRAGATAQNRATLLYGFALVGYQPNLGLLRGWSWDDAKFQECANALWALAWLGLRDAAVVQPLASRLQQLMAEEGSQSQATEQTCANSLWALAVMGPEALLSHSGLVEALLQSLGRHWETQSSPFLQERLIQLWQAQHELLALPNGRKVQRLRAILPSVGAGKLWAAMQQAVLRVRGSADESRLQRSVAAALSRLQQAQGSAAAGGPRVVSVATEVALEGVCGPVDVVLQLRQEAADGSARQWRVAVEVDGPSHFLLNRPEEASGATELRNRQLRRALQAEGGRLVCVPYREWNALKGKAHDEEAYLRALVQ
jgi:hypothetical protein